MDVWTCSVGREQVATGGRVDLLCRQGTGSHRWTCSVGREQVATGGHVDLLCRQGTGSLRWTCGPAL